MLYGENLSIDPGQEVKTEELIDTVTKHMGEEKPCIVTKKDLYENTAIQLPDDFKLTYSIKSDRLPLNQQNPTLKVFMNGEEKNEESIKQSPKNEGGYVDRVILSMGDFIFKAEFIDKRRVENPLVRGGDGRVLIYKKLKTE